MSNNVMSKSPAAVLLSVLLSALLITSALVMPKLLSFPSWAETVPLIVLALVYIISVAVFSRSRARMGKYLAELEKDFEQRGNSIHSMLDISGQALFSFDNNFAVLPEHSSFCNDFFGAEITGMDARELLFEKQSDRDDFTSGIQLLFTGKSQPGVVFDLLDSELKIRERTTNVFYRFIPPDKILVGISDESISREFNLQLELEERSKKMVFTAVSHQAYFKELLREAEEVLFKLDSLIATESMPIQKIESLRQQLHGYRGNLSFFGFDNTHKIVDELETYIGDMLSLEQDLHFEGTGLALKRVYFQELRIIVNTLGEDWLKGVDSIHVPRRQFYQLLEYVKSRYKGDASLLNSLLELNSVPMSAMFSQYPHLVQDISRRLGKRIGEMEIVGGDFTVNPDKYRSLAASCIHIIRNMVDHGIELPFEREELGKDRTGSIRLNLHQNSEHVLLEFSDDGRGVDFSSVARKAASRGLFPEGFEPNKVHLTKLLFRSGFSGIDSPTSVSGKGVGLAAVRTEVVKLGGNILVKTENYKGTSITIKIPVQKEV